MHYEHVDIDALPDRAALIAGVIRGYNKIHDYNVVKTAVAAGPDGACCSCFWARCSAVRKALVIGFFFAVATNFASLWFSDKIVLRMYGAQEVGPDHRLCAAVSDLAARAGLPSRACYVIPRRRRTRSPRAATRPRGRRGDRRDPADL